MSSAWKKAVRIGMPCRDDSATDCNDRARPQPQQCKSWLSAWLKSDTTVKCATSLESSGAPGPPPPPSLCVLPISGTLAPVLAPLCPYHTWSHMHPPHTWHPCPYSHMHPPHIWHPCPCHCIRHGSFLSRGSFPSMRTATTVRSKRPRSSCPTRKELSASAALGCLQLLLLLRFGQLRARGSRATHEKKAQAHCNLFTRNQRGVCAPESSTTSSSLIS